MDQTTKAWIEEVKKRDTYISLRFIEIDDYHKAHADRRELLKVIESQEKEIERLKCELGCAISICNSQFISNLEQVSGVAELLRSKKDI